MGWAKYDEDNRDVLSERNAGRGSFDPPVFNCTSSHRVERQRALPSRRRKKAYARALAACYAAHYGTPDDKED